MICITSPSRRTSQANTCKVPVSRRVVLDPEFQRLSNDISVPPTDMDDDFSFGASVWATSEPEQQPDPTPDSEPKRKQPAPLMLQDDFDDAQFNDFDDDFGAPAEAADFDAKDDDFGDFEDFEEAGEVASVSAFQDVVFQEPLPIAGPSSHRPWKPLQVEPGSRYEEIQEDVYEILDPIWGAEDISSITTDDPMREVEGVSQILVTSSR